MSKKADVSSFSCSSERLEELWVVCGFICNAEGGATLLVGVWWREIKNKLVEWKALVDTVGMTSADLEDKFLFQCFVALQAA